VKASLFSLLLIVGIVMLSLGVAEAAEDLIVAVDKATLIKVCGLAILAFQAEIWRNQRALFRSTGKIGEELKALQGYCRGKNGDCADEGEE
jgi:hypothetical protein